MVQNMANTVFLPVEEEAEQETQSVCCPPRPGTILAVKMPCGREALACVLRNIYPSAWYGYGPSQAIGLRVEWLAAQREYIRGYQMVWGKRLDSLIEGTLPWPPDPSDTCYGTRQFGEYRREKSEQMVEEME